jgi:hypothetical protein
MKPVRLLLPIILVSPIASADLPFITADPQNQTVAPGNAATLSITASGATSYQWRFNGATIVGATKASLTITNPQLSSSGYYMALAQNSFGWVPSRMAYLSVVDTPGFVPFSNLTNSYAEADYQELDGSLGCFGFGNGPITNGFATLVAGPALDQMDTVSPINVRVRNGYFDTPGRTVSTVAAGQTIFYRVDIYYSNYNLGYPCGFTNYTQPSRVLKLMAGGGSYLAPSVANLYFPIWIEWVEPRFQVNSFFGGSSSPTNQLRVPGETFTVTNFFWGCSDFGIPTFQWRKNGKEIGPFAYFTGGTCEAVGTATLTFTNFQPDDAGVYDVVVYGNQWLVGPKTLISVQLTNGQGLLQNPRVTGTSFVCDLIGAHGRNYTVQWSTNLATWADLLTVTNTTGATTFTNPVPARTAFYRSRLLP